MPAPSLLTLPLELDNLGHGLIPSLRAEQTPISIARIRRGNIAVGISVNLVH